MQENARFWALFRTLVNAPENAPQIKVVIKSVLRLRNHLWDIIHMLRKGPKMPTTDDTSTLRYVM